MTVFYERQIGVPQNPDLRVEDLPFDRLKPEWVDIIEKTYGGPLSNGPLARRIAFLPGINLITQGGQDDCLYVLTKGTVSVLQQKPDGTSSEQLRFGGRGAVVGEIRALNTSILRTATVRAVTPVEAIKLWPEDLRR